MYYLKTDSFYLLTVNFFVILELLVPIVTKYKPSLKFWESKSIVFFPIVRSMFFVDTTAPKAFVIETEALLTSDNAFTFIEAFEPHGFGKTEDT